MSLLRSPVLWFAIGTLAGGGLTAGVLLLLEVPGLLAPDPEPAEPVALPRSLSEPPGTPSPPAVDPVDTPSCPGLSLSAPPWAGDTGDPVDGRIPPVPASLRRRVAFWKDLWGTYPDRLYLFIDRRRPWVIHTRESCQDLFPDGGSDPARERRCDLRLIKAKRELVGKLRRQRRRPGKGLLESFGGNRKLARSAYRNVLVLGGRRDSFHLALERANHYIDEARLVFEAAGLPSSLAWVTVIESLADPEAVSAAGAVGAYQFMAGTARQYLMVGRAVDERLDPVREGWAAANYLKDLYRQFESWPLALTAYNTGPSRLDRLIKRRRTRDIGRLADMGTLGGFGFDGQNYYAQFAAILELTPALSSREDGRHAATMRVDRPAPMAEIAGCLGIPVDVLARHNPALGDDVLAGATPLPEGYLLALPPDQIRTASQP